MKEPVINQLKKEFQLERLIFFSDAVFAIAITLLVIEIKVPEVSGTVTEIKLINGLLSIFPKFIGFVISFFLIGLYWRIHHSIFGFVENYSSKLITINLLFLFGVVLMPFSTSFYSDYFIELKKTPVLIYVMNITYLGLMNYILWMYVTNPKHKLVKPLPKDYINYRAIRSLMVPFIFICMFILYWFFPQFAAYIPMLIPIMMFVFAKMYKRKHSIEINA